MELEHATGPERRRTGAGVAAAGALGLGVIAWAGWARRDRALTERTRQRLA